MLNQFSVSLQSVTCLSLWVKAEDVGNGCWKGSRVVWTPKINKQSIESLRFLMSDHMKSEVSHEAREKEQDNDCHSQTTDILNIFHDNSVSSSSPQTNRSAKKWLTEIAW